MKNSIKINETHEEIAVEIVSAMEHLNQTNLQKQKKSTRTSVYGHKYLESGHGIGGTITVYLNQEGDSDRYWSSIYPEPGDFQAAVYAVTEVPAAEDDNILDDGSFSTEFFNDLVKVYTEQMPEILRNAGL